MSPTRKELCKRLQDFPSGLTSAELAHIVGGTTYDISSKLSKAGAYGEILKCEDAKRVIWRPKIWELYT